MGKNRVIKIIGGLIAGMVAHKILEKYTNRKESLNHLRAEVGNYRNNLSDFIGEFNWNNKDKQRIKEESSKAIISELKEPHLKDVKFPIEEIDKLIEEILKELFN
jgi:hypothetical protein